jgi:sugar-specific transcriptional regulator TrmB
VWSTTKRKNVIKNIQDVSDQSKKEILVFSGDLSWLEEVSSDLKRIIRKGIKVRALAHSPTDSKLFRKNIALAKKIGIKVRIGYTGSLRGQVVDDKMASIASKRSERGINILENGMPGSEIENIYELMLFNNPSIVQAFKEYFEFWWKKLA